MNKITRVFLPILFLLLGPVSSRAAIIIDTGSPGQFTDPYYESQLSSDQWNAGRFSLTDVTQVSTIEGWIREGSSLFPEIQSLTLAVYSSGGDVPNRNEELFSQTFTVPRVTDVNTMYDWRGVDNMNLLLQPGDYWAAFEVRSTDEYFGAMKFSAPNPLPGSAQAYTTFDENGAHVFEYHPSTLSDITKEPVSWGFQISGEVVPAQSTVPEPATVFLLGGGLAGAIWRRRKFTKK